MEGGEHNRFVDELLEAALARYRSTEPRPGLEERVLANLRASPRPAPWLRWTWLPAATAAALAIAVVVLSLVHRHAQHAPAPPVVERAAKPAAGFPAGTTATHLDRTSELARAGVAPSLAAEGRRREARAGVEPGSAAALYERRSAVVDRRYKNAGLKPGVTAVMTLTRPEQFPLLAPLSEQEKLLLRYVEQTPQAVLTASQMNSESMKDLRIRDLDIPPLEGEELKE